MKFDMRTTGERLADLCPMAIAYARGHEQAVFIETGKRSNSRDIGGRVSVGLSLMCGSFVAYVQLDGFNICLSDPWVDECVALDNLEWLLCGEGEWRAPQGALREPPARTATRAS
jgi:hypothetical protein